MVKILASICKIVKSDIYTFVYIENNFDKIKDLAKDCQSSK